MGESKSFCKEYFTELIECFNLIIDSLSYERPLYTNPDEKLACEYRCQKAISILGALKNDFSNIPDLEKENILERMKANPKAELEHQLSLGLITARLLLREKIDFWNHLVLIQDIKKLFNEFPRGDFRFLPKDKQEKFFNFLNVVKNLKCFCIIEKNFSIYDPRGYTKISIVDEFLDAFDTFDKKLYVSATLPARIPEGVEVVNIEGVSNPEKTMFIKVPESICRNLLRVLTEDYNVMGITTSGKGKRMGECTGKYGGVPFTKDNIEAFLEDLKGYKGKLVWNYYRSTTAKGVNELHLFDGVFVEHWIARTDPLTELDPEDQIEEGFKNLYQLIGRVLRPDDNYYFRKRFVILHDEDSFKKLKALYKGANFLELNTIGETLKAIKDFAEPYPIKKKLKLELEIEPKEHKVKVKGKEYTHLRLEINLPKDYPKKKYKTIIEEA